MKQNPSYQWGFDSCAATFFARVQLSRRGKPPWLTADSHSRADRRGDDQAESTIDLGRQIFRFDTFGDEACGAILSSCTRRFAARKRRRRSGCEPKTALASASRWTRTRCRAAEVADQRAGQSRRPATTLRAPQAQRRGRRDRHFRRRRQHQVDGRAMRALHSTVDDSFAPGIGKRWRLANRDLNVGVIVSLAPTSPRSPTCLQVDVATVKAVLNSWGPGASTRYSTGR